MSLPGPQFTYQDYRLLPEDKHYELVEGDLQVTPAPSFRHQAISMQLALPLAGFVQRNQLGHVVAAPTDVILSDVNVVQPDILFIARDRQAIIDPAGGVRGAPDLVVEILSPGTAGRDRVLKRKLYGKYGVREYWVVDPDSRSIEVLTTGSSGLETWQVFPAESELASPLLPGLSVSLGDVFADTCG